MWQSKEIKQQWKGKKVLVICSSYDPSLKFWSETGQ